MKLSKIVLDKIAELGLKGASEYFGRSTAAIKTWQNKPDSIPAWAAEKAMGPEGTGVTGEIRVPEAFRPAEPTTDDVWHKLQDLHNRVSRLESMRLEAAVMPPQQQTVAGQAVTGPANVKPRPNWTDGHPSIQVIPRT